MRGNFPGLHRVSKIRGCFLVKMAVRHNGVKERMSQGNQNKDTNVQITK